MSEYKVRCYMCGKELEPGKEYSLWYCSRACYEDAKQARQLVAKTIRKLKDGK